MMLAIIRDTRRNPSLTRFPTHLHYDDANKADGARRGAYNGLRGLLLLTVRVGGETIDGILLELAVFLAHPRSLETKRV